MHKFVDSNSINWIDLPDDADLINGRIVCTFCQEDTTVWEFHQQHFIKISDKRSHIERIKRFVCRKRNLIIG